jgi:hypothetical protein
MDVLVAHFQKHLPDDFAHGREVVHDQKLMFGIHGPSGVDVTHIRDTLSGNA